MPKLKSDTESSDLAKNIGRISKAGATINSLADDATKQIRLLESFLKDAGVGMAIWTEIVWPDNEEAHKRFQRFRIGFDHYKGRWRLLREWSINGELKDVTPLDEAPRHERLQVISLLHKFVEAVAPKLEQEVEKFQSDLGKSLKFTMDSA